ncbi:MAG: hypothetical protein P4L35_07910 [Ignavibacteriaceae bacterium]|nr:hypothetical protein [Ignavibacteriaceae bacterium]
MYKYTLYLDVEDHSSMDETAFKLFEETYEILENGSLVINPKWGLKIGGDLNPRARTREERRLEDDYYYCSNIDILKIKEVGGITFCKLHNDRELQRLINEGQTLKRHLHVLPSSDELKENISSIIKIVGKFLMWYKRNTINFREFEEKLSTLSLLQFDKEKKLWKDNKTEFVLMALNKYITSPELYGSKSGAVRKLFQLYRFENENAGWTVNQALDLMRKNSSSK